LGAVYALEALAKASKSLHGPIFETLCAYIREEAPAPKEDGLKRKIETRNNASAYSIADNFLRTANEPDVVVQAILTIIGRRTSEHDSKGYCLNLRKTNLRKADLRYGNYNKANLSEAHLEGADLYLANLEGTNLCFAHLNNANLDCITFDKTTHVVRVDFSSTWGVSSQLKNDFRATVKGSKMAKWLNGRMTMSLWLGIVAKKTTRSPLKTPQILRP